MLDNVHSDSQHFKFTFRVSGRRYQAFREPTDGELLPCTISKRDIRLVDLVADGYFCLFELELAIADHSF